MVRCALAALAAAALGPAASAPARAEPAPAGLEALDEPLLGPQYALEGVEVRGNRRTAAWLIRRELDLRPGDVISGVDRRLQAARIRLLGLGLFTDVELHLRRGSRRGTAVLVVQVVERGTIVLNEIFLGSSEATEFWGGVDVGERNLLGRGVGLAAAFVLSTTPVVENARAVRAGQVRLLAPATFGSPLALAAALHAADGNAFFRRAGPSDSPTPAGFVALGFRRIGGRLGTGAALGRSTSLSAGYRFEAVDASWPDDRTRSLPGPEAGSEAIDFGLHEGRSYVSSLAVALLWDTRSDPVLPAGGGLLALAGELGSRLIRSEYDFGKITVQGSRFHRLPWGRPWPHVLAGHLWGGVLFGEAPIFERFFIGDLSELLTPRALEAEFSTLPARGLLGPGIREERHGELAARASLEYAVPVWRRRRLAYAADVFAGVGLFALATRGGGRARERDFFDVLPLDLTFDLGVRLDTAVGIFRLSVGNAVGRLPF